MIRAVSLDTVLTASPISALTPTASLIAPSSFSYEPFFGFSDDLMQPRSRHLRSPKPGGLSRFT